MGESLLPLAGALFIILKTYTISNFNTQSNFKSQQPTHVRSPTRSKFGNKSPMVVNPKSKTTRMTDKKGECNTTPPRGEPPPPLLLLAAALVLALVLFCAGSRLSATLSATTPTLHISLMEHASSLLLALPPPRSPSLSPSPLRHNRWASQQVGPLPTDLPYSITCCGFARSTRVR